ncbi:MAG: hypothetical protein R2788_25385 [Saprospiraceae bacterium]
MIRSTLSAMHQRRGPHPRRTEQDKKIVNNYSQISFNFESLPLLSWMEEAPSPKESESPTV